MKTLVIDLEANSLTPDKIYCVSHNDLSKRVISTETSYLSMKNILADADILIGHNITRFDIPVIEKLLGMTVKAKLVDTLALSWYLYPKRMWHGLGYWGEFFGVLKPKIDDWENLSIETYIHRCEEDVRINTLLWDKIWQHLMTLYDEDESECWRLIDYLQFKMDCAREQERSGWKLNEDMCWANLKEMTSLYKGVYTKLKASMPDVPIIKKVIKPAKPFKKDGSLSVIGEKWFNLLREQLYPKDFVGTVNIIQGYTDANPSSSAQVKDWLYSLGWVPDSFKYIRDKDDYTAPVRKIPQVRVDGDEGKELCHSVSELIEKAPAVKHLEGITVLQHRCSILKGFLANVDSKGYVKAEIQGFANTLRFKHKTVVNLPSVDKPYGKVVRGCLTSPQGWELMGADMVGLEDRTKTHYIYPYDPEYVKEMDTPGFDSHLDIALLAKMLTLEQVEQHKSGEKKYTSIRHKAKTTNYACVYGIQAKSLARSLKIKVTEAQELIDTYWERNWAVTKVCENLIVKTIEGQKWLFNPVAKFWYSLRHEKDRFSTLNQGTATYVFDTWVKEVRKSRPQLTAQFHDEGVWCIRKGNREKGEALLQDAIKRTNQLLRLNKDMAIEIQFGQNYSEIH